MRPTHMLIAVAGLILASIAAWTWLRPALPEDTPYFHWQRGGDEHYELVVSNVAGNPEFRGGVKTTPVPRSGPLRVVGTAEPGAIVEVSNPRTRQSYSVSAEASGAFAINAEAQRGDTLSVLSVKIVFRKIAPPRYSSAVVSRP